jgi:hypothetical protein
MEKTTEISSHSCFEKGNTSVLCSIAATDVLRMHLIDVAAKDAAGNLVNSAHYFTGDDYAYKTLAAHAITSALANDVYELSAKAKDCLVYDSQETMKFSLVDEQTQSNNNPLSRSGHGSSLSYANSTTIDVRKLSKNLLFFSTRVIADGRVVRICHDEDTTAAIITRIYEKARALVSSAVESANATIDALLSSISNEEQLAKQTEYCERWREALSSALEYTTDIDEQISYIKQYIAFSVMHNKNSNKPIYDPQYGYGSKRRILSPSACSSLLAQTGLMRCKHCCLQLTQIQMLIALPR